MRGFWRSVWQPVRGFTGRDWFIGLGTVALMLVWQILHRNGFYLRYLAGLAPETVSRHVGLWLFYHGLGLLLLVMVPLLMLKLVWKTSPTELGFGLGDTAAWKPWLMVGIPFAVLSGLVGPMDPQLRAEYPLTVFAGVAWRTFIVWEIVYAIYYVAWEGFFRGILLFGLRKPLGVQGAIFFQTALSCLVHIGKPQGELLVSLPAGILFGLVALRTGSIWPLFLVHWLLGAMTDFGSLLHRGMLPAGW